MNESSDSDAERGLAIARLLSTGLTVERASAAIEIPTAEVAAILHAAYLHERSRPDELDGLTPREWDVLLLLADSRTNSEISLSLDISLRHVGNIVSAMLGKTSAQSRTELVVRFTRWIASIQ